MLCKRTVARRCLVGEARPLNAPARRRAALRAAVLADQLAQPVLVEHLGAELGRLGELRAGAVAGDHVVGLLRDRVDDLATGPADQLGRLLAAEGRERSGQHQRLAVEWAAFLAALRFVEFHAEARLSE